MVFEGIIWKAKEESRAWRLITARLFTVCACIFQEYRENRYFENCITVSMSYTLYNGVVIA